MSKLTVLALSSLILASTSLLAPALACSVPTFQTYDNQTVEGKMTVKAGGRCSVSIGGGAIDPAVTKKPKNGTAEYREMRVYYAPKKGFIGHDEFTYERSRMDNYGKVAKRTVVMRVEVQP